MKPSTQQQYPYKVRPVLIKNMTVPPPLVTQRELRPAKVAKIAAKFDPNKLGILTVNMRNDRALVLDGQHRFHAAVQNGSMEELMCRVYDDLTDQQMADLFCGLNEVTPVATLDRFFVSCTANYERETTIRRIVESNGQKISRNREEGISTVGALGAVYDHAGGTVLGQVIRTINLGFASDPLGFDSSVLQGIGLVYNRWNGRTNEKALASRLAQLRLGPRELLRRAEGLRERTGNQKKHCVAATIVEIYNKGEGPTSSKTRLPSWWSEDAV